MDIQTVQYSWLYMQCSTHGYTCCTIPMDVHAVQYPEAM